MICFRGVNFKTNCERTTLKFLLYPEKKGVKGAILEIHLPPLGTEKRDKGTEKRDNLPLGSWPRPWYQYL